MREKTTTSIHEIASDQRELQGGTYAVNALLIQALVGAGWFYSRGFCTCVLLKATEALSPKGFAFCTADKFFYSGCKSRNCAREWFAEVAEITVSRWH